MATTQLTARLTQTIVPKRLGLGLFRRCRDTFLERRERDKLRARLGGLNDRELLDIGIARGEIDYAASCRSADPRGIVHSK
jgi:uncharacterized protein YjiS (DUF1127 family)